MYHHFNGIVLFSYIVFIWFSWTLSSMKTYDSSKNKWHSSGILILTVQCDQSKWTKRPYFNRTTYTTLFLFVVTSFWAVFSFYKLYHSLTSIDGKKEKKKVSFHLIKSFFKEELMFVLNRLNLCKDTSTSKVSILLRIQQILPYFHTTVLVLFPNRSILRTMSSHRLMLINEHVLS